MPYTIAAIEGEFNPTYILQTNTLSTTQSAVDDTQFYANLARNYTYTTWSSATSSYQVATTTLSGYGSTVIDSILLSGSSLIFGGCLASDFWNNFSTNQFNPPGDKTYINICKFDNVSPYRFSKLKNIGTYALYNTAGPDSYGTDRVFSMVLCGQNLVACGQFDLINTEITGAICGTFINSASLSSVSAYGPPFTSNITVGQVILLSAYQLLTKTGQGNILSAFRATYSGDPATNIAYYTPVDNKWYAFPGTTSRTAGQLRTVEIVNNKVYTAGYLENLGGVLYHDGSNWQCLSNSYSMTANLGIVLGLTNDYKNRLLITGSFSGFGGDYKKTSIMRYNFNTSSFESLGNGAFLLSGYYGGCYGALLCGANIVAYGGALSGTSTSPYSGSQIMRYIDEDNTMSDFVNAFTYNSVNAYPRSIYSSVLCGANVVIGGWFFTPTTSYGDVDSYVAYVRGGTLYPFYIPPQGPFTPWNRDFKPTTGELQSWKPSVRTVFDYVTMNYASGTGVTLDTGSENLYNNQALTCTSGLSVYGNSTYLGISGISVAF